MSDLVWYAAYGSNLSYERFLYYVEGGRPPGARLGYPGSRDRTPPRENRAFHLPGSVHFAGPSRNWDGGVAFFDPGAGPGVRARTYLISLEQLSDVVAQENHEYPGEIELDDPGPDADLVVSNGWYGRVVGCGDTGGIPVLTVTNPGALDPYPPSVAYLGHVARGLREAHGMTDDEIAAYLGDLRGVSGALSLDYLLAALAGS